MAEQEELALEDDLYGIVGVSPDSTPAECKRAFHRQARRLHPDSNPGGGETSAREFRRLVAAFELISNPDKLQDWKQKHAKQAIRANGAYRPKPAPEPSSGSAAAGSSILIQGGSLRTWAYRSESVELVQVVLSTEGSALDADVELWSGADQTPCHVHVYAENDGEFRPLSTVIKTPGGSTTVAVRNNGQIEAGVAAKVVAHGTGKPSSDCLASATTIEMGWEMTYPFDPSVDSVQVLLRTDGWPLNARVELYQGPNNNKQVIELYTENGLDRPFFCFLETPGASNTVRVVNTSPVEFPVDVSASVVPHSINHEMSSSAVVDAEIINRTEARAAEAEAEADALAVQAKAEAEAVAAKADAMAAKAAADADAVEQDWRAKAMEREVMLQHDRDAAKAAAAKAAKAAADAQAFAEAEVSQAQTEATIAKAAASADAARAQAELLQKELSVEGGGIQAEIASRLQVADQARETARSVDAATVAKLEAREAEVRVPTPTPSGSVRLLPTAPSKSFRLVSVRRCVLTRRRSPPRCRPSRRLSRPRRRPPPTERVQRRRRCALW